MGQKRNLPVNKLFAWVRRQSMKVKTLIGFASALFTLFMLRLVVKDHNHFFVAAEAVHFAGVLVLIYKLTIQKTCSGLSLKTQELTAIFLAVRLCCSFFMEGDVHTMLDFATLVSTLWVIYMMRFKLKSTYIAELDNFPIYYVLVPCAILAVLSHPHTRHPLISRILWAFCVYLEAISVLPQLRVMQNAKMVEPFTAHYVFALGVARFLGCAHWIIQVYEFPSVFLYFTAASGYLWFPMVLISEIVQTFILADFCYYYVKSVLDGQLLVRMPV